MALTVGELDAKVLNALFDGAEEGWGRVLCGYA